MEKSKTDALNDFIGGGIGNNSAEKQSVLHEREGLIERVDKVFVTKDGRQLLREQY